MRPARRCARSSPKFARLNLALDKARENLATIGRGVTAGLGSAVGETQALAGAWREVAAASAFNSRPMPEYKLLWRVALILTATENSKDSTITAGK
jgi:hypothetical protein